MRGDVDFENVKEKASMITPVPAASANDDYHVDVNTLKAAKIKAGLAS